jgi:hypothetical protein
MGKPLRGLRILPRAGGDNPLGKALRIRAAVCGFSRARRELDSSQFAERRERRSAVGQRRRRQSGARSGAPGRSAERAGPSAIATGLRKPSRDGIEARRGETREGLDMREPGREATRQCDHLHEGKLLACLDTTTKARAIHHDTKRAISILRGSRDHFANLELASAATARACHLAVAA